MMNYFVRYKSINKQNKIKLAIYEQLHFYLFDYIICTIWISNCEKSDTFCCKMADVIFFMIYVVTSSFLLPLHFSSSLSFYFPSSSVLLSVFINSLFSLPFLFPFFLFFFPFLFCFSFSFSFSVSLFSWTFWLFLSAHSYFLPPPHLLPPPTILFLIDFISVFIHCFSFQSLYFCFFIWNSFLLFFFSWFYSFFL